MLGGRVGWRATHHCFLLFVRDEKSRRKDNFPSKMIPSGRDGGYFARLDADPRLADGAVWCRDSQLSCGSVAAHHRASEQLDRSGSVPACSRCRFFAEIFLNLLVDKVVPELLLLVWAAEPGPRGRDAVRRHRGFDAGQFPGRLEQLRNRPFL